MAKSTSSSGLSNYVSGYSSKSDLWNQLTKSVTAAKDSAGTKVSDSTNKTLSDFVDVSLVDASAASDAIGSLGASMISGAVPTDVQNQVRQATSESASAKGLFGQSSRGLAARDLGLTSLQVQSQGAGYLMQAAQIKEMTSKVAQAQLQYNREYNNNVTQLNNAIRMTNLDAIKVEQSRIQFNATQNLAISELIVNTLKAKHELGYNYAAKGISSASVMQEFNDAITGLVKTRA